MLTQQVSYVLEFLFFVVFIFTCWNSLVKYFSKEISSSTKKIGFVEREYPSISICPLSPFKVNLEDDLFKNDSISLQEIKNLVKDNSWTADEIFYYVSYPTKTNPGYECLTTKDSVDPSRPCSFPFIWDNVCK